MMTNTNDTQDTNKRLIPPDDGVIVRMYRIGHGDCFLLAFPGTSEDTTDGDTSNNPVYVLIDCGYKPGSAGWPALFTPKSDSEAETDKEKKKKPKIESRIDRIAKNIRAATGGHIDVAVITHEHQDHVNGITKTHFNGITIGETWLAWTEDPKDELAIELWNAFGERLVELAAARNRLAAENSSEQLNRIDQLLELELGWDSRAGSLPVDGEVFAASGSSNKNSIKLFKDLSKKVKYIRPHEEILKISRAKNDLRIFALGPPYVNDPNSVKKDELDKIIGKLKDMDPHDNESFEDSFDQDHKEAMSPRDYFLAAVDPNRSAQNLPFAKQFGITLDKTVSAETPKELIEFFINHYGFSFEKAMSQDVHPELAEFIKVQYEEFLKDSLKQKGGAPKKPEVPDDAEWRRIDQEWLYSAEQLAIDINSYTNNSSLVLAFELGKGGKVLLFAADAQRGNWVSWNEKDWLDGTEKITAKDLLARTVLYKVGHHGSHNATLKGDTKSDYANLGWMAQEPFAKKEFTAMITAVRAWAVTQDGWDHPLKAIKDAILKKASGRVFQTDTDPETMKAGMTSEVWTTFESRVSGGPLYFDYTITR